MTPKLLMAALCDDVRHEANGKRMLIGLFEVFNMTDFQQPLPNFAIFARVGFDTGGIHPSTIRIQSEAGDFRIEMQGVVDTPIEKDPATDLHVANIILNVGGLKIPRPGRYHVFFELDGGEIGDVSFFARTVAPPTIQ